MQSRLLAALLLATSFALSAAEPQSIKPESVRVILVGDSTMATRTGYGDELCRRFQANVTCINVARGGRSSGSYRAEGLWENVLSMLRDKGSFGSTYVLIQFGHNDQPGKPGRSTDLATEFPVNMSRYVDDVKAPGANVVLLTPLTRRSFRDKVLQNDLKPWADAIRLIAENKKVPLLPLNADSAAAVEAMGSAEADTLAQAPPPDKAASSKPAEPAATEPNGVKPPSFDHTHLGAKGAAYFAGMVAQEIKTVLPALAAHLETDKPTK